MIHVRDIPLGNGGIIAVEALREGRPVRGADGALMICTQRYARDEERPKAEASARKDMAVVWGVDK